MEEKFANGESFVVTLDHEKCKGGQETAEDKERINAEYGLNDQLEPKMT